MAVIACANPTTASGQCPVYPDGAIAITPSDTNTFAQPVTVFAGVGGNITCTPANSGTDVLWACVTGQPVPFRVLAVKATGTTATGIVAVY